MAGLLDDRDHVGASDEKFYKTTLVQSERLTLGLTCLEPERTPFNFVPQSCAATRPNLLDSMRCA